MVFVKMRRPGKKQPGSLIFGADEVPHPQKISVGGFFQENDAPGFSPKIALLSF